MTFCGNVDTLYTTLKGWINTLKHVLYTIATLKLVKLYYITRLLHSSNLTYERRLLQKNCAHFTYFPLHAISFQNIKHIALYSDNKIHSMQHEAQCNYVY